MFADQYLIYAYAFGVTFAAALALTVVVRHLALRWDILDHPGGRKTQRAPVPLLGGVAIVAAFYLVIGVHIVSLDLLDSVGERWLRESLILFLGEDHMIKLAGLLAGGLLIFLLGVVDDLYALTPWVKLAGQIAAAGVLVLSGMRLEFFDLPLWITVPATIFWVVLLTNSLNFLDNMDGLCAGVAIIAAFSFFLCVQSYQDEANHFVRLLLMIFAGAAGGFLYHNVNPARIYMGDAGSMFCGYFLAAIAVAGTFHVQGESSALALAAPVLALSVPLFDTLSVIYLRWRAGQPLMRGDTRHFSHRLVALGMTPRQAVEFILLVAGVLGLGGALLHLLDTNGTIIILAQAAGVFFLIVLLMNADRKKNEGA
jgi:UDP-GlcNAc:undecaprenyl-phosphate GlcNAc-1-phosphate transferase